MAGMILKSLKSLLNSPGAKLAFSLQQFHLGGRFKERAVKGIPFPCHPSAEAKPEADAQQVPFFLLQRAEPTAPPTCKQNCPGQPEFG